MSVIYPRPGSRSTVYVGGFDETMSEDNLHTAFVTFGEIKEVFIPRDATAEAAHRGFGFVEFESGEDAKAAIDNMHMTEIFGQTIRCNLARPTRITTAGIHTAPIWELEAASGISENLPEYREDAEEDGLQTRGEMDRNEDGDGEMEMETGERGQGEPVE